MVFSSTVFLFVFLPALLLFYYLPIKKSARRTWRNTVLLLFSIGFYAWGEPVFIFVMLTSVLANWLAVLIMEKSKHRKFWLSATVIFDILLLGIFKYVSFISENIAFLTGNDSVIVSIALPIGISFFTFQMMSYVFDVYYGKAKAQKNPAYVALYITLFPQLIAGPIVRYSEIENDILTRKESFDDFSSGFKRFVYGLGKKILIANFVAQIADNVFNSLPQPSVMMAWLGAIAYTLQIYFDFSGYSDMAIGLGKMFGFHFSENFNYPYVSKNITDFWRRWHISLSTWFRDYVYIPLGGNRVKKSRWIFNLFAVWLLTGIWHGANWTFVLWGMIYFVALLIEKLSGFSTKTGIFSRIYTFLIVVIAWVFFRASSISAGITYVAHMFGIGTSGFIDGGFVTYVKGTFFVLVAAIIGSTPFVKNVFKLAKKHGFGWIENIWIFVIFALCVCRAVGATYNPFIYFNF